MGENDDISKLVVLVVGVSAIALFAYLIFKERQTSPSQPQQLSKLSEVSNIEKRLMKLSEKVDAFAKVQIKQLTTTPVPQTPAPEQERKIISLQSKPKIKQSRAEFFGMI